MPRPDSSVAALEPFADLDRHFTEPERRGISLRSVWEKRDFLVQGGHMMYEYPAAQQQMKNDLDAFFREVLASAPR